MAGDDLSPSFEEALNNQKLRETEFPEFYDCPTIAFQYQKIYNYYEQVKRYYDVFGKENVKIIFFEEFVQDKANTYNHVLQFLGLKAHSLEFKQINKNKEIKSESVRSLVHTRHPAGFFCLISMVEPSKPAGQQARLIHPAWKADTKKPGSCPGLIVE